MISEDLVIKITVGAAFIAVALLGAFVILEAAKEYKEETKRLETKGCKIIGHEPGGYKYGYHDGKRVSVYVSGFDLWQCPGEPVFKR